MAIDPLMQERLSGRSGDPSKRLGEALAKNAKAQHDRDAMPKGVTGGFNTMRQPGIVAQIYYWFKDRVRGK